MSSRLPHRLHELLERHIPERRLYIRSGDHTRFVRLSPSTQLLAWTGSALLVGWGIIASAVLLMDGIGSSSYRDQAGRDLMIYQDRLDALSTERDRRAAETVEAQDRFGATLDQVSSMQGQLLGLELRKREMEAALAAVQSTLRRTMDERDAAKAQVAMLSADAPPGSAGSDDLSGTLDLLSAALANTAAERDRIMAQAEASMRLVGELDVELRLMEEQSDEILGQIEDALTVSMEPLDDVLRAAGFDPATLIDQVQGGHSGEDAALGQIRVSTSGTTPADDATLRANRILGRLDDINHYRVAMEAVPLGMPVQDAFRYTSPFGPRWGRMHEGVDMAGPVGTPIYATADGVVTFAGWQNGYGRIVIVRHAFGLETRYPHLNVIRAEVGQEVARGEQIGDMGNSGRSTGPHLHYEVRVDGEAVDPMTYLRAGRDLL